MEPSLIGIKPFSSHGAGASPRKPRPSWAMKGQLYAALQLQFPEGPDFRADQSGSMSRALFRPDAGSLIPGFPVERARAVPLRRRGVWPPRGTMPGAHVSRVRALYRRILLLHRVLPPDLKALGDQYVKDEFRRHKTVGSAEAQRFLQEWEASDCPLYFALPLGSLEVSWFVPVGDSLSQGQPVPFELKSTKLFNTWPKFIPISSVSPVGSLQE